MLNAGMPFDDLEEIIGLRKRALASIKSSPPLPLVMATTLSTTNNMPGTSIEPGELTRVKLVAKLNKKTVTIKNPRAMQSFFKIPTIKGVDSKAKEPDENAYVNLSESACPILDAYESPLEAIRAFRFSPRFEKSASSLTFTNDIDPMAKLCQSVFVEDGRCYDSACPYNHIDIAPGRACQLLLNDLLQFVPETTLQDASACFATNKSSQEIFQDLLDYGRSRMSSLAAICNPPQRSIHYFSKAFTTRAITSILPNISNSFNISNSLNTFSRILRVKYGTNVFSSASDGDDMWRLHVLTGRALAQIGHGGSAEFYRFALDVCMDVGDTSGMGHVLECAITAHPFEFIDIFYECIRSESIRKGLSPDKKHAPFEAYCIKQCAEELLPYIAELQYPDMIAAFLSAFMARCPYHGKDTVRAAIERIIDSSVEAPLIDALRSVIKAYL